MASPRQRLDNCHTQKYMSRIWAPTGNQRERSLNLGNDNPSYALLLTRTAEQICFSHTRPEISPHTHSLISPPLLDHSSLNTAVSLAELVVGSLWSDTHRGHLEIPQNRLQLTTGRLATPAGDFPTGLTDWQTCFEWLQNIFSCDLPCIQWAGVTTSDNSLCAKEAYWNLKLLKEKRHCQTTHNSVGR